MPGQFFHSLYSQFKKGACWAGKSPIRVKRVKPVFFTFPFRQHPDEFTLIDIVLGEFRRQHGNPVASQAGSAVDESVSADETAPDVHCSLFTLWPYQLNARAEIGVHQKIDFFEVTRAGNLARLFEEFGTRAEVILDNSDFFWRLRNPEAGYQP